MTASARAIAALAALLLAGFPVLVLADTPSESGSDATVTDAMIRNATIPLNAQDATFPLNAKDATFPLSAKNAAFPLDAENARITPSTTVVKGDTKTIRLVSDVFFAFDSASLNPAAIAKLPDILAAIPKGAKVKVNGYTDSVGTDAYNLPLSQQRGKAVANAMANARPDLKITTNGYGKADPVAPNKNADGSDSPVGRAQNRRVEIVF